MNSGAQLGKRGVRRMTYVLVARTRLSMEATVRKSGSLDLF